MKMRSAGEVAVVVSPPAQPWDIDCSKDPGFTKQEFLDDCDVNLILKRCTNMGVPLPGAEVQSVFADVSEVGEYGECMRRVTAANEAFLSLPVDIRREFDNSPAKLLDFVADDANRARAVELGLIPKPVVVAPSAPVVASGTPPPGLDGKSTA